MDSKKRKSQTLLTTFTTAKSRKLDLAKECDVLEIDKDIKNKFRFAWLQQDVSLNIAGKPVTEKLEKFIAKTELPGQAKCMYCNETIAYGSRGVVAFKEHAQKKKHISILKDLQTNYSLNSELQPTSSSNNSNLHVPFSDRKMQCEVLI